jgi:hypothetical protein
MSNKISNEKMEELIKKIMCQTTYTEEIAKQKLEEFNYDFIRVLKDYMGITEKPKNEKIKSLNQEIYKQIRQNLDASMTEYRNKNPIDIKQAAENLRESEERQKSKI